MVGSELDWVIVFGYGRKWVKEAAHGREWA